MKSTFSLLSSLLIFVFASLNLLSPSAQAADRAPTISVHTASADGVQLHYLSAGSGPPVLLLHGYTQTSAMWRSAMPRLAKRFRVIAPDLPGIGDSEIPEAGLDMKTAAVRVHALAHALGLEKVRVVGHDIGLMVAYAYAAQYPSEVQKLVVMDAFLPGIGAWEGYYYDPKRWHFFFNGPTPEALVQGRERVYFDHFWNDFAADPKHSLPESDRRAYTTQYARPGRMRAAWAYFAAFPQTAKDFAELGKTRLELPVLAISGAKAGGQALGDQMQRVAAQVTRVVLENTGHWVLEERPAETIEALDRFL